MDMLAMDVREKLDRLVLPEDVEDPIVLRFDPSLDPIMRLALRGGDDLTMTRRVADRRLKQELETVRGVAAARVKGGFEEEIRIDVDQDRLAAMGITLEQVRQAVGVANVNLPGGSLRDKDSQYLIRTVGEFTSINEIAVLVLRQDGNAVVRLQDVAAVWRGTKEREEITRVDGIESVEIDVYKEGDANIVTTAREVHARIADLQASLPPGARLVVLFDQSRFIERAVGEVRLAALVGGILAVLVLLAFLRRISMTAISVICIPFSLIPLATAHFISARARSRSRLMEHLERLYVRLLDFTLHHRWLAPLVWLLVVESAVYPFMRIDKNFDTSETEVFVQMQYEFSEALSLERKEEIVSHVEGLLEPHRAELHAKSIYSFWSDGWSLTRLYMEDGVAFEPGAAAPGKPEGAISLSALLYSRRPSSGPSRGPQPGLFYSSSAEAGAA